MNTTEKQLRDTCLAIAAKLSGKVDFDREDYDLEDDEQPSIHDWLGSQLCWEYQISQDMQFLGARVDVTIGGPNIWVDTRFNQVHGSWGGDNFNCSYQDVYGLNSILEDEHEIQSQVDQHGSFEIRN